MIKKKRAFIILVLAIACVTFSFIIKFYLSALTCDKANKILIENVIYFEHIADEVYKTGYNSVSIRNGVNGEVDEYTMKISREPLVYETVPVPENLINSVEKLFEQGVKVISGGRNSINFSLWSSMDESRGIIYMYSNTQPTSEQIIKYQSLSIDNWYYYIHNYEKAIKQNPDKFIP